MKGTVTSKRNKRARRRRIQRFIERCLLVVCLIALFAIIGSKMLTNATETSEEVYYKYYTQIEIEKGDSLWSIAQKYKTNGNHKSTNDYIEEVIEINQLSSTNIQAGQCIIVPYFDLEYK